MISTSDYNYFTSTLLSWNDKFNNRQMPWKGEKDPYRIWISEIILQQTRVEQGLEYYKRFIASFPDVATLANADEALVFKHWEGLGYYSRCRNLLFSARMIMSDFGGSFPSNYDEIKSLKGVGDYTAAAIASFAFTLPYAVVDGNVSRVLSRYFGIETPIDTSAGKSLFSQLAQRLLDKEHPGIFNQAIMDFGAIVCKPQSPVCSQCPFNDRCIAFFENRVEVLPVKQKLPARKKRFLYYFLINYKGKVYVQKRVKKDIWQNLYEFPLIETNTAKSAEEIIGGESYSKIFAGVKPTVIRQLAVKTQLLTHQSITGSLFVVSINKPLTLAENMLSVDEKAFTALPFPKFINAYLQDKNVSLNLFQA